MANITKNCSDCGLPLLGKSCESGWSALTRNDEFYGWREDKTHFMICCDCFDETCGIPAKNRTRPKPPESRCGWCKGLVTNDENDECQRVG